MSFTHNKLKPHDYDGSDDLDEYLAQFNIVSELNGWSYTSKSLFLASSMVGPARAILCELDSGKRRDFNTIVSALQNRFGSVHRAEVFRSQLQVRQLERNESIPQLAQSIRKLTRKAYPSATSEVVELLALDYFIDALPDTEIRLRLREVGPKTIGEAERIAVRLDAHKVADRSRGRHSVRNVTNETDRTEKRFNELSMQMRNLMDQMKNYEYRSQVPNYKNNAGSNPKHFHNAQSFGRQNRPNRNNQSYRNSNQFQRKSDVQGNERMSSLGAAARQ
jgi:hypothetical protein